MLTRRLAAPWSDLSGDVRFAWRGIRRSPAFSLTAMATIAIGLGLAAAIFSFADGYLFRPLPFPGGDRTYYVDDANSDFGFLHASDAILLAHSPVAHLGFVEWDVARVGGEIVLDDRRLSAFAYEVSPGFRATLRLPLIGGRDFAAEDHLPGAPLVAWMSYRYWQREFGGDRGIIGRVLRLDSAGGAATEMRIVGILGPEVASFDLNNVPPDLVVPRRVVKDIGPNRFASPLVLLPPDLSVQQASEQIAAVLQAGAPAADGRPRKVALRSLQSAQVAGGQPTARVLFVGAMLVLILAALNLVQLLLTRGAARAAEVATRGALGASRWHVARLFLVESAVLGTVGTVAGLAFGKALSSVIAANVPQFPTAGRNLSLVPMMFDTRVIGFAAVLGLVMTVVGGLWPAWRALRGTFHARTNATGRASSALSRRLSRIVLTTELTAATIVLVGTAFIGLGIYRYLSQPIGFETADRTQIGFAAPQRQITESETANAIASVRAVPGIVAAGLDTVPASAPTEVPGRSLNPRELRAERVPSGYFAAWGMRLRQGRWFSDLGTQTSDVAIVNTRFAQLAWPDANPLGSTVRVDGLERQVIGLVDSRKTMLDRDAAAVVYVPMADADARAPMIVWAPGVSQHDLASRVTQAIDRAVPGARTKLTPVSLDSIFFRSIGEARFQAPVMLAFGVLAIAIAGVGVFGLMSYLVEQRRREFGIRIALGARSVDVWRTVIRESIQPTVVGLIIGSASAYGLEALVRSKVFGWQSSGPIAVVAVVTGLLTVAVVAALIPAARAARTDPARTLKAE